MSLPGARPPHRAPTRVLVVDDHALFRRGLRITLAPEPDIEVVGECVDGPAAVELVLRLSPDIVLVDLATPFDGGIAACRAVTAVAPDVRVLLLVAHGREPDAAAVGAAGAWGVLVKDASVAEVASAIRTAAGSAPPPAPAPPVAALD